MQPTAGTNFLAAPVSSFLKNNLCIYFSLILLPQFIRVLLEVTEYNVLNAHYSQAGMLNQVSTELVLSPALGNPY